MSLSDDEGTVFTSRKRYYKNSNAIHNNSLSNNTINTETISNTQSNGNSSDYRSNGNRNDTKTSNLKKLCAPIQPIKNDKLKSFDPCIPLILDGTESDLLLKNYLQSVQSKKLKLKEELKSLIKNELMITNKLQTFKEVTKLNLSFMDIKFEPSVHNPTNSNSNFSDPCIICLNKFIPNALLSVLECQHVLHKTCRESWFKNNISCPACRLGKEKRWMKNNTEEVSQEVEVEEEIEEEIELEEPKRPMQRATQNLN